MKLIHKFWTWLIQRDLDRNMEILRKRQEDNSAQTERDAIVGFLRGVADAALLMAASQIEDGAHLND